MTTDENEENKLFDVLHPENIRKNFTTRIISF